MFRCSSELRSIQVACTFVWITGLTWINGRSPEVWLFRYLYSGWEVSKSKKCLLIFFSPTRTCWGQLISFTRIIVLAVLLICKYCNQILQSITLIPANYNSLKPSSNVVYRREKVILHQFRSVDLINMCTTALFTRWSAATDVYHTIHRGLTVVEQPFM